MKRFKSGEQIQWLRVAAFHVLEAFEQLERAADGIDEYDDDGLLTAYEHALGMLDVFHTHIAATAALHDTRFYD